MKAAIVGGGVIGGAWAARFLLHGWDVVVSDPNPKVATQVAAILANAEMCLPALADVPMPPRGKLSYANSLREAVTGADWVQESVPEQLALKHKVIAEIQAHAPAHAILGSSTSGFKPSELQEGASRPGQILVAHPFNPVYLLPLAEVVAGEAVSVKVRDQACEILRSIGMEPLVVRHEIDAHIADRFLEAVWREALWLIKDDIATTEEIDNAIRYGFGLRWGQMGLFETYRLAGGEEGMAHFIRQFGPCLAWPWTKLMDVPELDEELVNKIASQSDAQSGKYSIRELEAIRDRNLVGFLRSLKERDWGAGRILNQNDKRLAKLASVAVESSAAVPTRLLKSTVLPAWIDYNGHMTEYRYVQVFSDSCEALLRRVGLHDKYVAAGHSYYTAESHNQYFDEVGVNEPYYTTAQILMCDAKRLHVFYRMHAAADDRLLASLEAMYLHAHMQSGKVVAADKAATKKLMAMAAAHADLPKPESAGRFVGQR
ncbi:MAG: carnitine 3-dehydrogenase [Proteobacteria bacterium]|nr:carnitine 3-dehydrogenase [Pseudomonadota bacterium]